MSGQPRITIEHVEVRFALEGEPDEMAFGTLFTKYIDRWSRAAEEERARTIQSNADRSLGDQGGGS